MWLRDFLPDQIPNARIMSYGYNSIVAFTKSVGDIDDFARDLLTRLSGKRQTVQVSEFQFMILYLCHFLNVVFFLQTPNLFFILSTIVVKNVTNKPCYLISSLTGDLGTTTTDNFHMPQPRWDCLQKGRVLESFLLYLCSRCVGSRYSP
jgi:hypothetical protein